MSSSVPMDGASEGIAVTSLAQLGIPLNIQGPDEDEHYEIKESRRPNKAYRKAECPSVPATAKAR